MKGKQYLGIIIAAFIGGAAMIGINNYFLKDNKDSHIISEKHPLENNVKLVNTPNIITTTPDFTTAAEVSLNAVVHVNTIMGGNSQEMTIYDFLYGNPHQGRGYGMASGSGVILSEDGYIVTNNHVIEHADQIKVVLNDKREYKAHLIGRDPSTDIALLKVNEKGLPTIPYGNSEDLKVGEWVLAVGNPFNLTSTVTAGIVSAKGRDLNILKESYAIEAFIQTDAAVNPGNSGGALVNTTGELVGINTAIASQTGSYSGYSFAVPVSIVKKVVADLIEYGTVQRALMGVSIRNVDSNLAEKLNLNAPIGVYINSVNKGSGAEEGGIKAEDVIIKIDNKNITKVSELQEEISKHRPGDRINVTVLRNGESKELKITLKNSLGTTKTVKNNVVEVLGASFEKISDDQKKSLGIPNGVKVIELGKGKLFEAGASKDFIITKINRTPVRDAEDIKNIINNSRGAVYIEGVYPDGSTAYYAFGIH